VISGENRYPHLDVATDTQTTESPSKGERPERKGLGFFGELPILILTALILALIIKAFLFQAFFIPSGSMEPTLMPGDRVLVNKVPFYFHDPHRGEIIVFENPDPSADADRGVVGGFVHWLAQGLGFSTNPDEDFIKRVIGLPGDTVQAKDGYVYVNGQKLDEPYLTQKTRDFDPVKVPPDSLFVMGDNRRASNDSRFGLGFVPIGKVVGKAFVKIWPPGRMGLLH
jgi:signal peptidase I